MPKRNSGLLERKLTMKTNRKLYVYAQLAIIACLALTAASPLFAAENFLYADTTAALSYSTFVGMTPIPGLSLTLPAANAVYNTAVVTLNMPNLYLNQPTSKTPMSAVLQLVAPFTPQGLLSVTGSIGCDTSGIGTSATKPITIVVAVPLGSISQLVEAEWASNGSSTVNTNTFASLSAILVRQ
jgi:hypothetical protein